MSEPGINPYIGPRPFTRHDRDRFYGREREARELLALVLSQRTVLFYAASGAGKSSLINARLLPALHERDYEVLRTARVSGVGLPGANLFPGAAEKSQELNVFVYNLKQSLVPMALEVAPAGLRARYLDSSLSTFLLDLIPVPQEEKGQEGKEEEPRFALLGTAPPAPPDADETPAAASAAPGTEETPDEASAMLGTDDTPDEPPDALPLKPRCLVIDQFEELFTAYPAAWEQRDDFFRQVRQAQEDDPYLWVLFAMREDYVARLEPHLHLLPDRLRARYSMQRMGTDAAQQAIERPVDKWLPEPEQRPFEDTVAQELVDNLRRVRVPPDQPSEDGTAPGEYVEPVQLQIVCHQMWEGLREYPGRTISRQNLATLVRKDDRAGADDRADADDLAGFVSHALRNYYEDAIAAIAHVPSPPVAERALRDWFSNKLITEQGTRGFVQQGGEDTGGLPNSVVTVLDKKKYLVRGETRAGGTWYELTHDRFIDVIVTANEEWNAQRGDWITGAARRWDREGKDDGLLLRGTALVRAETRQRDHPGDLRDLERRYIAASVAQRNHESIALQRRKDRARNRLIVGIIALGLALAVALVAVGLALWQRVEALENERHAISGQLAAQARTLLDDRLDLSLLLGVAGIQVQDTMAARSSLDAALQHSPHLEAFLWGRDAPIVDLAYGENGSTLASVSEAGTVLHWDTATHQKVRELDVLSKDASEGANLDKDDRRFEAAALSPDGTTLALSGADGVISLWNVSTQPPVRLRGVPHEYGVASLTFSPDGRQLAAGYDNHAIRLWDVDTIESIATFFAHTDIVTSLAFDPDGETLASGDADGAVYLWDLNTGKPRDVGNIKQPADRVRSLAFSPDGKTLAIAADDGSLALWDLGVLELLSQDLPFVPETVRRFELEAYTPLPLSDRVLALAFSPERDLLAAGDATGAVTLWSLDDTDEPRQILTGHATGVRALTFSPDSAVLVSGAEDGSAILWRTDPQARRERRPAGGYGDGAGRIAVSPDGRTLALHQCPPGPVQDTCGDLLLHNLRRDQPPIEGFTSDTSPIVGLAFAPRGRQIAVQYDDEDLVTVWNPRNGNWRYDLYPDEPLEAMAFTYQGRRLATADRYGDVTVWKLRSGEDVAFYSPTGKDQATVTAFSPNGQLWATGYDSGLVTVRRVKNGRQVYETQHESAISALAFGPRSRVLAIGDVDGALILRDRLTNASSVQPTGRQESVSALAFSPDGSQVAVGYDDGALLNCAGRVQRAACLPIATLNGRVLDLGFRWDGSQLFARDARGGLTTWDMSADAWVALACRAANRPLSEREWAQFGTGAPYQPTCERLAAKEESDER